MKRQLTKLQQLQRYWNKGFETETVIKNHNETSVYLFHTISKLSELLPNSLNNLSILSDMITDAMVVSGRGNLSRSPAEMKREENGVVYNSNTEELVLDSTVAYDAPIRHNKSYIQTSTSYTIFDTQESIVSSFKSLLEGVGIKLVSVSNHFRYTFSLEFSTYVEINNLLIKLGRETQSYPLLSELYYINLDNKKEYITILNTLDKKVDLDDYRVKENEYNLIFNTVKTNRIYFTLEDVDKDTLILDSIRFRKLNYRESGSIIFGPIVSTFPILKASIEAKGNIEGARFYVSHDKQNWNEIALPTEMSRSSALSKIISFNTINNNSLKIETDVKELYIKVDLEHLKVLDSLESVVTKASNMNTNFITYQDNDVPIAASVYKEIPEVFYGEPTYVSQPRLVNTYTSENNFIEVNGKQLVRGFVESKFSFTPEQSLTSITTYSKALKVGGDSIDASKFDPTTTKVYGYSINKHKQTINTSLTTNLVLSLKPEYSKGVYTVRQENRDIKIDLSTGFITSCLDVLIVVEDKPTVLYDETGKEVKQLTIKQLDDVHYISLLEENMFYEPITENKSITFNKQYPFKLNSLTEYSIHNGQLISLEQLLPFEEVYTILTEEIKHITHVSKENKNKVELVDKEVKDKYTENKVDTIPPYLKTRAIKLQSKHIQKGSLKVKHQ